MKNIRIEVRGENYIVVIADSERFGDSEVMYEGNTFDQCFDYLKREIGVEKLWLTGMIASGSYEDRTGRCFPAFMNVMN